MRAVGSLIAFLALFLFSSCSLRPGPIPNAVPIPTVQSRAAVRMIVVDTKLKTLTVLDGDDVVAIFQNVAFGAAGPGLKHARGDAVTPLGTFSIGWISRSSKFKTFIGLNYPSEEYAQRALAEHRINPAIYEQIHNALQSGKTPPQGTILGGNLGIHGLGSASLALHRMINWTDGCVALDNSQIQQLLPLVHLGMRVEIR